MQALAHFGLFLVCLGLIHAKQISRVLLVDRLDQKEREEYYETPKFHGVSTNDLRFMEADKLVNYTLVILYSATAYAATYAICTLGLLIGKIYFYFYFEKLNFSIFIMKHLYSHSIPELQV